mmetsp:Transcript_76746/g.237074  ORF Transcript_76746/g.237074 Transcript_76746/m.237074 type:complete len:283 (-) Transcript_76746:944-1792(-)
MLPRRCHVLARARRAPYPSIHRLHSQLCLRLQLCLYHHRLNHGLHRTWRPQSLRNGAQKHRLWRAAFNCWPRRRWRLLCAALPGRCLRWSCNRWWWCRDASGPYPLPWRLRPHGPRRWGRRCRHLFHGQLGGLQLHLQRVHPLLLHQALRWERRQVQRRKARIVQLEDRLHQRQSWRSWRELRRGLQQQRLVNEPRWRICLCLHLLESTLRRSPWWQRRQGQVILLDRFASPRQRKVGGLAHAVPPGRGLDLPAASQQLLEDAPHASAVLHGEGKTALLGAA